MKVKKSKKLEFKTQTIAKLNIEVMDTVKGGGSCGGSCFTDYPCELTDPNYTCATQEYCATDEICTNPHAYCCEDGPF